MRLYLIQHLRMDNIRKQSVFDSTFADGQYKKTVEPHPSLNHMDFVCLRDGIQETVHWFKQTYAYAIETLRL